MVLVEDADAVLIGNKVEAVVPYHTSDEFSVAAEQNGKIIDLKEDWLIIQYADGTYKSIDLAPKISKNASAGFWIENQLITDYKVGDKFKKNEVIAYNPKIFKRNEYDRGASMKLGVLAKIAIMPNWDIYEDSTPITQSLANRLATTMIAEQSVVLDQFTYVDKIIDIGAKVKTGDVLIRFDQAANSDIQELLNSIRQEDQRQEIIEDSATTIKSKYTGEIADVSITMTIPFEEFDPSVQKLIKHFTARTKKRNKVLEEYSNPTDGTFYKSGQIIKRTTEVVTPGKNGKIDGQYISKGVKITFYIKYHDIASKGNLQVSPIYTVMCGCYRVNCR